MQFQKKTSSIPKRLKTVSLHAGQLHQIFTFGGLSDKRCFWVNEYFSNLHCFPDMLQPNQIFIRRYLFTDNTPFLKIRQLQADLISSYGKICNLLILQEGKKHAGVSCDWPVITRPDPFKSFFPCHSKKYSLSVLKLSRLKHIRRSGHASHTHDIVKKKRYRLS